QNTRRDRRPPERCSADNSPEARRARQAAYSGPRSHGRRAQGLEGAVRARAALVAGGRESSRHHAAVAAEPQTRPKSTSRRLRPSTENRRMTIDVHAHYVPQSLIAAARQRGADIGVRVIDGAATPALEFSYGFKVRPFFPKLVETAAQRT